MQEEGEGALYLGKVVKLCSFLEQSFIFSHRSNFVDNRLRVISKLIYDSRLSRQMMDGEGERDGCMELLF